MNLCERCQRIDLHSLPPALDTTADGHPLATLSQIVQGAASACSFCRIVTSCLYSFAQHAEYLTETGPIAAHADTVLRLRQGVPDRGDGGKLGGVQLLGPGSLKTNIPLYAKKESPAWLDGDILESNLCMPLDPHGLKPSQFVKKRMDICMSQHEQCRVSFSGRDAERQPSVPPRRLLSVIPSKQEDSPPDIRLLEIAKDSGLAVQYAALSHCWGPPEKRPPCTLRGNLAEHKEGIPWLTLSQTFRDACGLCADLGIGYLWIDSLCIIQDDAADWETEASVMGLTYEQASLVIAASAAADSSQGLFGVRRRNEFAQLRYRGRRDSGVYAYQSRSPKYHVDNGPLNARAWVLQEYILARRAAHFTRWGVVWTCRRDPAVAVDEYDGGSGGGRSSVHQIPHTWENVVRDYSRRGLTYKSDKLVAIQGLAAAWAERQGKTPFCGLVLEDMPLGLAWFWSGHGGEKLVRDVGGAPSWSWASVTGRVDFLMRENEEATPGMAVVSGRIGLADQVRCPGGLVFDGSLIKEVDARIGPFDCLPSYIEDLRAIDLESETMRHLVPGSTTWYSHTNHDEQFYMLVDRQRGNIGWCAFDEKAEATGPISCLPLFKESVRPWYMPPVDTAEPFYMWCLVVRRAENGDGFQRVGWGRILDPSWIEGEQRQELLLI
ncbi:hypothetical protein CH35J_007881 [Colletotrichum higginsianum]|uniref:Heterokaryon incompatibility domain-containing protein n=1 Tax=Colletotrichum higginsianum TaxID=80884 RepID=A0A4T0VRM4_9PEZI|nr:hypothetical protein CH35J_007881 [Colletotrichum higginsianum]